MFSAIPTCEESAEGLSASPHLKKNNKRINMAAGSFKGISACWSFVVLSIVISTALIQNAVAQSNSSTPSPNNTTHVPVLNFNQVVEIVNGTTTTSTTTVPTTTTAKQTTTTKPTTTTTAPTSPKSVPPTTKQTTTTTTSTTPATTTTLKTVPPSTAASASTAKVPPSIAIEVLSVTVPEESELTTSPADTFEDPATNVFNNPSQNASSSVVQNGTTENPAAPAFLISNVYDVVKGALKENPTKPTSPRTTTTTTEPTTTTTKRPEPLRLGPIVKIAQGELRPAMLKSRGGRKYYAFRGVPYAIPPVYNLRFKDVDIAAPWPDVLNATTYGPSCIQYNIISEEVEGEEDCLFINIFTPKLPAGRNKKKGDRYPVMVFFHQGAFMFGTSGDFEEKYMMDEDVVLVTVNYRLNVFGFLNTQGDTDAKGNQGLKDQLLALKFIRENIHHFNGEPNSVTIFGESAGASSVHYHMLSEKSRGLFQRAISMSGTALSPWAFTRSPRKMAKKLGTFLNCPTTDMSELFSCLQGHDAKVLAGKIKDLYEWNTDPITPFAPSIEVEETSSLSSFMTQSPYNLMKAGQVSDVPWMLGVVENVCLLDAWSILVNPQLTQDLNVDWHRIAPATFMYKETALEPDAVSNQIKAYYFGTKDVGNETAANLTNLYSDRYFNHGIRTSALMHVRNNEATQVYLYMFSYKGSQSHTQFAGINDVVGVSEGDDLRYLFNTNRFDDIPLDTKDGDISQKFVKLWVSFARNGKPTDVWGKQEWKRITADQITGDQALMYYNLNEQCGFVEEPFSARLNFWDNLPLNENGNELYSSLQHQTFGEDDDLFDRYN